MAHDLKSITRPVRSTSGRPISEPLPGEPGVPTVMQLLPNLESGPLQRIVIDVCAGLVDAGWRTVVVSAGGPLVRELEKGGTTHVKLPVDSDGLFATRRNAARIAEVIANGPTGFTRTANTDSQIAAMLTVARSQERDRKSTRLNSSHSQQSRMPSSA